MQIQGQTRLGAIHLIPNGQYFVLFVKDNSKTSQHNQAFSTYITLSKGLLSFPSSTCLNLLPLQKLNTRSWKSWVVNRLWAKNCFCKPFRCAMKDMTIYFFSLEFLHSSNWYRGVPPSGFKSGTLQTKNKETYNWDQWTTKHLYRLYLYISLKQVHSI